MSLFRPSRAQWTWMAVGGAAGLLASLGIVLVASLAAASGESAEQPTVALVASAGVSTVMLAVLVGYGVERLVAHRFKPAVLAVGGALAALLVGATLPLIPVPIVVLLGALAVAERRWVRVVAAAGLLYAMGLTLGSPPFLVMAASSGGEAGAPGSPAWLALSVGFVAAAVVAFVAQRVVHPDRPIPGGSADT